MTLKQATLPVPQFDHIQLDSLKQEIEKNIHQGQQFLDTLQNVPTDFAAQVHVLEQ
ncbi:MAG: hypothetical protein VX136_15130, partial [Pseudomonadota bacterium]|nr:hypothetical protein [Pseudomonadota bacterium]